MVAWQLYSFIHCCWKKMPLVLIGQFRSTKHFLLATHMGSATLKSYGLQMGFLHHCKKIRRQKDHLYLIGDQPEYQIAWQKVNPMYKPPMGFASRCIAWIMWKKRTLDGKKSPTVQQRKYRIIESTGFRQLKPEVSLSEEKKTLISLMSRNIEEYCSKLELSCKRTGKKKAAAIWLVKWSQWCTRSS